MREIPGKNPGGLVTLQYFFEQSRLQDSVRHTIAGKGSISTINFLVQKKIAPPFF